MATFEKLYKDFREKKVECDKDEQETLQAFEMETGARRNMITVAGEREGRRVLYASRLDSVCWTVHGPCMYLDRR